MKPTVEIREGVFLHTVWFAVSKEPLSFKGISRHKGADFMACLIRTKDGEWELRARLRFVVDDKIFDSDDEKICQELRLGTSEDRALSAALEFVNLNQLILPDEHDGVEIRRDGSELDEIIEILSSKPWCHIKPPPKPKRKRRHEK